MFKLSFTLLLIFLTSLNSYSSEPLIVNDSIQANNSEDYKQIYWYASLGRTNLNKEKSISAGINDAALSLQVGMNWQRKNWNIGAGIGSIIIKDNNGFSTEVVDSYGHESNDSSNISSLFAYGEGGYSLYLFNNLVSTDFQLGYEYLSTERSIPNCSDCPSESIDINSGLYIKPKINLYLNNFMISANYQRFINNTRNSLSIALGMKY